MIASPEVSHLVAQYEIECGTKGGIEQIRHHEKTERAQKVFLKKVEKLAKP